MGVRGSLFSLLLLMWILICVSKVPTEIDEKKDHVESLQITDTVILPEHAQRIQHALNLDTIPKFKGYRHTNNHRCTYYSFRCPVCKMIELIQNSTTQAILWLLQSYNILVCNVISFRAELEYFGSACLTSIHQLVHHSWSAELVKVLEVCQHHTSYVMRVLTIAGKGSINHADVLQGASVISDICLTMEFMELSNISLLNLLDHVKRLHYLFTLSITALVLYLTRIWLIRTTAIPSVTCGDYITCPKHQLKTLKKIKNGKQMIFNLAVKEKEIMRLKKLCHKYMKENESLKVINEARVKQVKKNVSLTSTILDKLWQMEEGLSAINSLS